MSEMCVALLAFNRPAYQEQVWRSVKDALCGQDVLIFIDGLADFDNCTYRHADHDKVKETYRIAKDIFPGARIFQNAVNVGCPVQWGGIYSTVFDHLCYDACLIIEDDLILSRNYIRNIAGLVDMFATGSPHVGMVGCFGERHHPHHDPHLDCLTTAGHLWGMATWRDRWQMWSKDYYDFCHITTRFGRKPCVAEVQNLYRKWGFRGDASAVNDGAFLQIMLKHNQVPLSTVANCARYIGETGEYGTPDYFKERRYSEMPFHQGTISIPYPHQSLFDVALDTLKKQYGYTHT